MPNRPAKGTTKARREMDAALRGLETAAKDVEVLFRAIKPYIDLTEVSELPFASWTMDHWGLILANLGGTGHDRATIERWVKQEPILMLSLVATIFRVGYSARQYDADGAQTDSRSGT